MWNVFPTNIHNERREIFYCIENLTKDTAELYGINKHLERRILYESGMVAYSSMQKVKVLVYFWNLVEWSMLNAWMGSLTNFYNHILFA